MPKQIGDYVFEKFLGSGSYGEVYKARNLNTNEIVAVKMLDRKKIRGKLNQLFNNELHVLQNCQNENVIKLIAYQKTQNNYYMIMEYCNEGDLKEYLKSKGYLTEPEAIRIILQIINGFKIIHSSDVIHRDLKPANILINNARIKIADFGFCKLLSGTTYTSTILGTPSYMAPEILLKQQYNYKVDIWSLGIMFYELLYGKVPFRGKDEKELYQNILIKNPTFDNRVSEMTQDIIHKMLCVDPIKRITWDQIFAHGINNYDSKSIPKDLQPHQWLQINKVIEHPQEIVNKNGITVLVKNWEQVDLEDTITIDDETELKHIVNE